MADQQRSNPLRVALHANDEAAGRQRLDSPRRHFPKLVERGPTKCRRQFHLSARLNPVGQAAHDRCKDEECPGRQRSPGFDDAAYEKAANHDSGRCRKA